MPGRFPRFLNPLGKEWNEKTRQDLYEYLRSLWGGMSGLQGTPDSPSIVAAGDIETVIDSQAQSPSNHIHSVSTAAPGSRVALGGDSSEGDASSLLRSDATLVLEDGSYDGDFLVWDAAAGSWASVSGANALAASNAYTESLEVLHEILTLLRSINHMIHESLNVTDHVDAIRRDMGSENLVVNELRTLSQLLMIGFSTKSDTH